MYVRPPTEAEDRYRARAAFYGLYLREVCGCARDEAAALVIERYPRVRPWLEKLTREGAGGRVWKEEAS